MNEEKMKIQLARRVTVTGSVLNAFLAAIKFSAGWFFNSRALMADAVDSTTDLLTDVITLIAYPLSRKPTDKDHPYGHGRIEALATMFVSAFLVAAAVTIGYKAVHNMMSGEIKIPSWPAMAVAVLAIILKESLYRWTKAVGKRLNSRVLLANAWHHRSDAFSSIAVFIGVTGSILIPGMHSLDSIASLVVVVFILRAGLKIFVGAMDDLLDKSQDEELLKDVVVVAMQNEAVQHAHRARSRRYGSMINIDMDIEVAPNMTVADAHEVAHKVQANILEKYSYVGDVIIHIEPEGDHETGEGNIRI